MVNVLFFFFLPLSCLFCSYCHSKKSEEDTEGSVRGRKVVQKEINSDEESDDFNENLRLLKPGALSSDYSSLYRKSSETIFDIRSLQNPFDEKALEDDTEFVVQAINESHESLRKLVSK